MNKDKILILGENGLIGFNAVRYFSVNNKFDIITCSRKNLDLRNQHEVELFFQKNRPDIILMSAAVVGGIQFNIENPVNLILDNLEISVNVLRSALNNGIKKVINFGSNCMYPKQAVQPLKPSSLWEGELEDTNKSYAAYKLATLEIVNAIQNQYQKNWITVIPSTIYGPNDNFSLTNSHVLSSLIRKFHEARNRNLEELILWGDGAPLREFLYVDDLLSALELLIENDIKESIINVGSNEEISIFDLAQKISEISQYKGRVLWDKSKPNGNPRKLLDSSFIRSFGWSPSTNLDLGLKTTYNWFINPNNKIRS